MGLGRRRHTPVQARASRAYHTVSRVVGFRAVPQCVHSGGDGILYVAFGWSNAAQRSSRERRPRRGPSRATPAGAMAAAPSSGSAVTPQHVILAISQADAIVSAFGRRRIGDHTYSEYVAQNPEVLQRWASSRARNPLARDQRAFAKLVLDLIEAATILGYETKPLDPPPKLPAAPPASPILAARVPNPVTPRRKTVKLVHLAEQAAPAVLEPARTYASMALAVSPRWVKAYLVVFVLLFLALCAFVIISRPEIAAMFVLWVPIKLASWVWAYVSQAGGRLVSQIEHHLMSSVFGPVGHVSPLNESGSSDSLSPGRIPTEASYSSGFLGWAMAIYLAATRR